MRYLATVTLFIFGYLQGALAQEFTDVTTIRFEPRGDPVKASFRRLSSDQGELRWQSSIEHAYLIEEGDLVSDWRTYAAVYGQQGETSEVIPLRTGSQFFRVSTAPAYPAHDVTYLSFHLEPYVPGWKMDRCTAEWRWSNGTSSRMDAGISRWQGIYTNAGPLLLTLMVTAPDGSSVTGRWAMSITNAVGRETVQLGSTSTGR